jgi:hypothetical protein
MQAQILKFTVMNEILPVVGVFSPTTNLLVGEKTPTTGKGS